MNDAAAPAYAGYIDWKRWERLFSYTPDEAAYFAGETRGIKIARAEVFEIGFGSGAFLAWARDQGARVVGAEIIPALQEAARREEIELLPPEIENVAQGFAGRFDAIFAFDVFEHFSQEELLLRLDAVAVMLKPGGFLTLRFPNAQSPFGLAAQHGDPTHKIALCEGKFERFIQSRPFEIHRYGGAFRIGGGSPKQRLGRFARRLLQDALGRLLNAAYALDIPWDPVVVLVLRRK